METTNAIATLTSGADTLFLLLGAVMVLAMHAGFAFLELGTVRNKNQVNALVKIITDFGVSTLAYFFHRLFSGLRQEFPQQCRHADEPEWAGIN